MNAGLRNYQIAVLGRHGVVAGSALRKLVALNLVSHNFIHIIGDATRHDGRDGIVANESFDIVLRPSVSLACIGKGVTLGGDGDSLRIDGQRTGYGSDGVVGSDVFLAMHHLITLGNRVVACLGIGHVGGST